VKRSDRKKEARHKKTSEYMAGSQFLTERVVRGPVVSTGNRNLFEKGAMGGMFEWTIMEESLWAANRIQDEAWMLTSGASRSG
jgi:hypothetical protein